MRIRPGRDHRLRPAPWPTWPEAADADAIQQWNQRRVTSRLARGDQESHRHATPVHGQVDKTTQQAAWTVGDNKQVVVETGLSNLTQDQSTALVHFGASRAQQYQMTRLKQPPSEPSNTGE